jgi:hypothetical protein
VHTVGCFLLRLITHRKNIKTPYSIYYQAISIISIYPFKPSFCLQLNNESLWTFQFCTTISEGTEITSIIWLLPLLLLTLRLLYMRIFWNTKCCLVSLDVTGIRGRHRNFRNSSLFAVNRTNSPSARFVSAASLVCKVIGILGNGLIHDNRFCSTLQHSLTKLSSQYVSSRYLMYIVIFLLLLYSYHILCLVSPFSVFVLFCVRLVSLRSPYNRHLCC